MADSILKKPTVLVVDDVPENIDVIAGVLANDYEIKVALNGQDALAIALTPPFPDLILLDIMMPGMDGYEVCRKLKEGKQTKDIPVIFATAMSEVEDETKGFDVGGVDYITKPINPLIVTARIKSQIKLKQYQDHLEELVSKRTSELEEAMQNLQIAKEAAEAASEIKTQFLANMSHELHTPMAGILTSADLLSTYPLETDALKIVEMVMASGNSMLMRIDNMLRFSQFQSNPMQLNGLPFELDALLGELKTSFFHKGVNRKINLMVEIEDENIPNALIGDPEKLKEVFNNLLDNAVKFSADHSKVTIGLQTIEKSSTHALIQMSVKDNGIGIAPEHYQKIFEPLTQVDASRTKKYDGTGMGLSICKQIIHVMGGEIRVESSLGAGSTFYFLVSFKRQAVEQPFKLSLFADRADTPQAEIIGENENFKTVDIEQFSLIIDQLAMALKEMEPVEIKLYTDQMKQHVDNSKLTKLMHQIDMYEYDDALVTLQEISDNMVQ